MAEEKNYRLTLAYDGTRYAGWQRQGNTQNTLQAKLETLLTRLLRQSVELHASGRTDAGVHARRQVCSFRAATGMPTEKMAGEIARFLPEDIVLIGLEEADARFHARLHEGFEALAKAHPERIKTIDASGDEEAVWNQIWKSVLPLI